MNMNEQALAQKAAQWALGKVGCTYSQEKRTQENIFDCSSLVARAYSAQGKRWKYGGSVPLSNQEVYDDDFELLWPADYASIGKQFGSTTAISAGKRAGDLQFLCTDSKTSRVNRITHVAMVTSESQIVHAGQGLRRLHKRDLPVQREGLRGDALQSVRHAAHRHEGIPNAAAAAGAERPGRKPDGGRRLRKRHSQRCQGVSDGTGPSGDGTGGSGNAEAAEPAVRCG